MEKSSFFRKFIRKSFLEEAKLNAETRTKLNVKNIFKIFTGLLILIVLGIFLYTPSDDKRKVAASSIPDYTKPGGTGVPSTPDGANRSKQNKSSQFSGGGIGYSGGYGTGSGGMGGSRNRNANQVIRRGTNGNDPGAQIPIGTMIGARLLTAIHSVNTASPVLALITSEVANDNGVSIPANTKIIGNATFDGGSRRIQIRFSTLVYEDGSQHPIQAMAMMRDGSAGLDGDYHSGMAQQQVGKFIGTFVSGLANGLRDQTSAGMFGSATQEGSVKNGLLNGVALSSQDVATSYSNDLSNEKPSMSIDAGSSFFLFLEKEYLP